MSFCISLMKLQKGSHTVLNFCAGVQKSRLLSHSHRSAHIPLTGVESEHAQDVTDPFFEAITIKMMTAH